MIVPALADEPGIPGEPIVPGVPGVPRGEPKPPVPPPPPVPPLPASPEVPAGARRSMIPREGAAACIEERCHHRGLHTRHCHTPARSTGATTSACVLHGVHWVNAPGGRGCWVPRTGTSGTATASATTAASASSTASG